MQYRLSMGLWPSRFVYDVDQVRVEMYFLMSNEIKLLFPGWNNTDYNTVVGS